MLLTITTTHQPPSDLGYLLHKNPARAQSFPLSFGEAHVFYPELSAERCTAAVLLDVDPVGLVRGRAGPADMQYVSDRPYAASSFLSVAIARVFGSALSGTSKDRPELAATPIPLEARIAVVPCGGGEAMLRSLFEPLGYEVEIEGHPLDEQFPAWGASRYYTVTLRSTTRLADLLRHLYVLVPVLDDAKHYWVSDDEVEKLLRQGEGWLAAHPARDLIARRYLRHQGSLARAALARLVEDEEPADAPEEVAEARTGLHHHRLAVVAAELRASGAARVADLGCGEGRLLQMLLDDRQFTEIVGMDVASRSLETARDRLRLDTMQPRQRERIRLIHGSLMYRDPRIAGFDAAAVVEVIEHLDPPRLRAFERVVFEFARPGTVVLTTPNRDYNTVWPTLPAGEFRHGDHRFEWSRAEFGSWAGEIAERFGYQVRILPVGPEDPRLGAPTQMGVFMRS
ncbi:MAG TPA: 3' terminal RNA ribose 2'-O-methyltransferase Hen1 [Longimicrobium sp.]|nr:3' terminal RNA ribose 2'-O-methyltransferase Hen1 [Longimicrobium sp.]